MATYDFIKQAKGYTISIDGDPVNYQGYGSTCYATTNGVYVSIGDRNNTRIDINTTDDTVEIDGVEFEGTNAELALELNSTILFNDASGGGGSTSDAEIIFTDIETGNASTTKHGFLPKLSGNDDEFLNGAGEWAEPSSTINLLNSKGLLIGDSTIIGYSGTNGIDYYLLTPADIASGATIYNQAVAGDTIVGQQTIFLADPNKALYDWIVVEIGLNDVDPSEAASVALSRYQTLINNINSNKKSSCKIIVSCMTPCRQRLIDVYGETDGVTSYNKWLAMNSAIMGSGVNSITGVDYRIDKHVLYLKDASGNLKAEYDTGDHVHENNTARAIIASVIREQLNTIGLLTVKTPDPILTEIPPTATGIANQVAIFSGTHALAGDSDLTFDGTDLTTSGKYKSVVSGASASFKAFNPAGGYPRAQFEIGNSSGDTNVGLSIGPSFSGSGVQKPCYVVISTNKALDSGARDIAIGVTTTEISINSEVNGGSSSAVGGGLPIKIGVQTPSLTSVNQMVEITHSVVKFPTSDIEVETLNKGVILKSPDGTRYKITVANGGTLTVTAL